MHFLTHLLGLAHVFIAVVACIDPSDVFAYEVCLAVPLELPPQAPLLPTPVTSEYRCQTPAPSEDEERPPPTMTPFPVDSPQRVPLLLVPVEDNPPIAVTSSVEDIPPIMTAAPSEEIPPVTPSMSYPPVPSSTLGAPEIAAIVQAGAAVAGVGIAIAAAYLPTRSNPTPPTTANNCGIISGHVDEINYQYFSNGKDCDISPDLRLETTEAAVLKALEWMAIGGGGDACFHMYRGGIGMGILQIAAPGKQVVGGDCLYSNFPIRV
ncbi:hypothetical protein BDN72DRAFT_837521 [Pluteus cervinus]|uniref:Uncharacterized protein n=1 Tax=Pluteus cervinus TaxID=181527 RepID=A0ACD3B2L0_9AGAR|nr:hypothetical protein BDN72DRAFT_837521 [Pluteus cervinus]